jgi:hypothetical protein
MLSPLCDRPISPTMPASQTFCPLRAQPVPCSGVFFVLLLSMIENVHALLVRRDVGLGLYEAVLKTACGPWREMKALMVHVEFTGSQR